MVNYTVSEENHLKAIYHLQQRSPTVTTNELARQLQTRPASVTDMMKKLRGKKLLHYQPYRGFRLSSEGNRVALGIIRRHRLWEYFLAEKLQFSWDEVHDAAEELEHVRHPKLIEKLDAFLGFPRFDPHGDPIPDSQGKMEQQQQLCLTAAPLHQTTTVSSVSNHTPAILELLDHRQIGIGTRLEVTKKFDFDGSLEVKPLRKPSFLISRQLAEHIFVQLS